MGSNRADTLQDRDGRHLWHPFTQHREWLASDRIIVDPGIGFAKNAEHNWALLAGLDLEMPDGKWLNEQNLKAALHDTSLEIETIDRALVRRFTQMFRFGHFEHFAANQQGEELRALADYVIQTYFTHPSYWKIDDAPYFSIYELYRLVEGLGGLEPTRETELLARLDALVLQRRSLQYLESEQHLSLDVFDESNRPLGHAYDRPEVGTIVAFRYLPEYPRFDAAGLSAATLERVLTSCGAGAASSADPHDMQNFASGGLSEPHSGQVSGAVSELPQSAQKRAPSRLVWPPGGQFTALARWAGRRP